MDVVAVEGLVVVGLERHPLHAEAVVARDQFLRGPRIFHPLSDVLGDVLGELGVGGLVGEDLPKFASQMPKPGSS